MAIGTSTAAKIMLGLCVCPIVAAPVVHKPTRDKVAKAAGYVPAKNVTEEKPSDPCIDIISPENLNQLMALPAPDLFPAIGTSYVLPGPGSTPGGGVTPPGGGSVPIDNPETPITPPVVPPVIEPPVNVPEPGTFALLTVGLGAIGYSFWRRKI